MQRLTVSPVRMLLAGLTVFAVVLGIQAPAYASANADVWYKENGINIGSGHFNADPYGSTPGDAIRACDTYADGWGIEVYMDFNFDGYADRTATTRGYNSPYCSPWASGDLPEETLVLIKICKVKGTSRWCNGGDLANDYGYA